MTISLGENERRLQRDDLSMMGMRAEFRCTVMDCPLLLLKWYVMLMGALYVVARARHSDGNMAVDRSPTLEYAAWLGLPMDTSLTDSVMVSPSISKYALSMCCTISGTAASISSKLSTCGLMRSCINCNQMETNRHQLPGAWHELLFKLRDSQTGTLSQIKLTNDDSPFRENRKSTARHPNYNGIITKK
jgi:hypothetical protein